MPPRRRSVADVYVAKVAFSAEIDGAPVFVQAGDRIRAGHELLRQCGAYFEPVDEHVHYDVEQATAAPGELREH